MGAQTPNQLHSLFVAAFNRGDIQAMLALYEPTATFAPQPEVIIHGGNAICQALQRFLALKGHMTMTTTFSIRSGDVALLRGQWNLIGTGLDGERTEVAGKSLGVARQQANGQWLLAIDHPLGASELELAMPPCLTDTPKELHPFFVKAFNTGDLEGLLRLYETEAALVPKPHQLVHGHKAIRRALQQLLSLDATFALFSTYVIRANNIALLRGEWRLHGTTQDGQPVATYGKDVEVARQQADGTWRFLIDHAYGAS